MKGNQTTTKEGGGSNVIKEKLRGIEELKLGQHEVNCC